ncbi:glycoside hydrolase family 65 protein, partial [Tetragenococcus solitarius]
MERIDYIDEWNIAENYFSEESLGKLEVNMAMGNGYLGVRNCHEESYVTEKRNMFVAGIFNKFSKKEVTELANMPDISKISVWLNGKRLTLNRGRVTQYRRVFNYRNGESVRSFIWESETGFSVRFIFKKFVSMYNKHLIVTEMTAENLGKQATMAVQSGIDGTFTNTGSQHFEEGEKRYLDNQFLYLQTQTTEKKTKVALATCHKLNKAHQTEPSMKRRQLYENKEFDLLENETVTFTKYSLLKTGQDLEYTGKDYLRQGLIDELNSITRERYRDLLSASATVWEKIWEESKTEIRGDTQDALLLNAARYHLHIMTPVHDNRLNISGKGLSGEGYKGHTFWDTEIFILPYFVYTFPHWAKSLVTYRLKGLGAAKENADLKGYSGALYPWESAWLSDGEVTPKFGGIDVVSGKRREVLTGKIEHHITGDVIYGLMQYLKATNDIEMKKNAFSLLMETAIFWTSRVNYNKQLDRYEILDVIGPDEYKEHVNNNAYTNYLAKYNLDVALRAYAESKNIELKNKYKNQFNIIKEIANKLYLPVPNKEGILPQDDNYLKKQMIDLTKYFEAEEVNL